MDKDTQNLMNKVEAFRKAYGAAIHKGVIVAPDARRSSLDTKDVFEAYIDAYDEMIMLIQRLKEREQTS